MTSEDPRQYLNDEEEAARLMLAGWQTKMWTAVPGIVQTVNLEAMTCVVQVAIQFRSEDENGNTQFANISVLQDVPLVFPKAGGFAITFPVIAGDEVLVVFSCRCIDSWWQNGGFENVPMEYRMHDLSDGFALPGPTSQPNVLSGISATDFQMRSADGTAYISITSGLKFGFQNSTVSLKKTLTDLQTALYNFMTTLAAFSGGGSPTTQAMLQVPANTCKTALATVLTEIGELLS